MAERLLLDIARMKPEGIQQEGEVDIIDIDESLVHPFGGVRYRLDLQLFGRELLVRGHLEQDFDLVCCRCGKDFDTTIKVDDFTLSVEVDDKAAGEVDITDEAREAVLLELPTYPVCSTDCPGVSGAQAAASSSPGPLATALEAFEAKTKAP